MKKYLSLLLAVLMLCPVITSCSGTQEEDTAQETAGAMESTAETETLAAEKAYVREGKDFDGKTFNVIADLETGNNLYYDDLTIEEESGEVLNDAVFRRNLKVIEDYNVKLTSSCVTESEAQMVNAVSAGDPSLITLTQMDRFCCGMMELFKRLETGVYTGIQLIQIKQE